MVSCHESILVKPISSQIIVHQEIQMPFGYTTLLPYICILNSNYKTSSKLQRIIHVKNRIDNVTTYQRTSTEKQHYPTCFQTFYMFTSGSVAAQAVALPTV